MSTVGTDILRYALVAGYYNENGIIERDKNQEWDSSLKVSRYTVRSNVDVNVTPTTLFRANVGVFLQTRNAPPGDTGNQPGHFLSSHACTSLRASGYLCRWAHSTCDVQGEPLGVGHAAWIRKN